MSSISGVDQMLSEMRSVMAMAQGGGVKAAAVTSAGSTGFADALKNSLDSIAASHEKAESLQTAFVMGDDKVSLSDVMISMQKAGIEFQAAVQVRNKFVMAYNDVMNMQV